jgi:tRNA (guanine-N7-)-methyltransferase
MVRQHVNPLSRFYQEPRALPPLADLFSDPRLPLHLDIGSARGRFLLAMAPLRPDRNHLGVEIRRPLVSAAEADRQTAQLGNLHFLFTNASINLPDWLVQLPPGRLVLVTLQFPDPWFKSRHHKRRVLQPPLVRALAAAMAPGSQLFLQSDVLALIEPMVELVEASGCFDRPAADPAPWRPSNPLPVPSERERHVECQDLPIYRVLFDRNRLEPIAANGAARAHP